MSDPAGLAQEILDRLEVPRRLGEIRDYVWRGGDLHIRRESSSVAYVLLAEWETPVLDEADDLGVAGLVRASTPTVVGQWRRSRTGYTLRVGIEARVPRAIAVQAPQMRAYVPFVGRPHDEIERALDERLTEYGRAFLDACLPVPQAMAADAERLRQYGL